MANNENRETERNVYSMAGLTEDNQRAAQDVIISGYAKYLENYDDKELSQGAVDVENYNTRYIGLWSLARYEEGKKVRSGLVKFYGRLTTEAICNAVRDTFAKGDYLGFQAAVENLVLRREDSLILKLVFELRETVLPLYVISTALVQTLLRRGNSNFWTDETIRLATDSFGKAAIEKIDALYHYFSSLSADDILHMKRDILRALVDIYKDLGELCPRDRILQFTVRARKDINPYGREIANMDAYVREFFHIGPASDGFINVGEYMEE